MSVFKPTGTAHYWYKFQRGGRTFSEPTNTADKTKAKAVERAAKIAAEKDIAAERESGRAPMTLDKAFGFYYVENLAHLPSGADGQRELRWIIEQKVLPADMPLHKVSNAEIETIKTKRREKLKRSGRDEKGRPLFKAPTAASINRTLMYVRAALYWARDKHNALLHPKLGISLLPEAEPRVRGATAEQEAAVFAVLREDYADLIDFTLLTGMRLDAVISLRWREDVDFAAGTITYQKKRKRGQAVRTGIVPITPEIETILRRQIGRHRLMVWTFVAHRAKGKGFEYEIGKRYPITYWNLRTRWQRAATKAGVPGLRFHDLRHTAALRMLAKTGNLVNVQMMLGHANIATSRKYTEMDLSALRAAMIEAEAARPARVAADASENVVALKRGEAS